MMPVAPDIVDGVDTDKVRDVIAKAKGIDADVLRDAEVVDGIRQKRAQQQQQAVKMQMMMSMAEMGKSASKANKDTADARATSASINKQ
jgi:hypothetical protein